MNSIKIEQNYPNIKVTYTGDEDKLIEILATVLVRADRFTDVLEKAIKKANELTVILEKNG